MILATVFIQWPPWPYRRQAPQVQREPRDCAVPCGSGQAREAGDAVAGTGCAGVRGLARSHRDRASV